MSSMMLRVNAALIIALDFVSLRESCKLTADDVDSARAKFSAHEVSLEQAHCSLHAVLGVSCGRTWAAVKAAMVMEVAIRAEVCH